MLITETGAALANAESYCTVAFATDYHSARGNAAWLSLADDTVREALLRKATDAMLALYRERWKGVRATATQALDWPRLDVVVDTYARAADEVPQEVQKACAILALKAISGDLDPDPTQATKKKKVASLEVEYYEPAQALRLHKSVTDLLSPFLTGAGMSIRLVRA
jgi:hypothetical protein